MLALNRRAHHSRIISLKVVLSGEGSDEVLGGYSFLLVDFLRQPDPASVNLGIDLPSASQLYPFVNAFEAMPFGRQDHFALSRMSFVDSKISRAMLGGISTHRIFATTNMEEDMFSGGAVARFGKPDATRTIAESIDPKVRDKAVTGQWHSLNIAMVCFFLPPPKPSQYLKLIISRKYIICKTLLGHLILNQAGERAEMAHSIEGRPPFLDHHLVDYVDKLPP